MEDFIKNDENEKKLVRKTDKIANSQLKPKLNLIGGFYQNQVARNSEEVY